MEKEPVYKKFYRKADKHLNGQVEAKHGKQTNQKIKPYVVLQFLLKYSDENNVCSAFDIIAFLEDCGLSGDALDDLWHLLCHFDDLGFCPSA